MCRRNHVVGVPAPLMSVTCGRSSVLQCQQEAMGTASCPGPLIRVMCRWAPNFKITLYRWTHTLSACYSIWQCVMRTARNCATTALFQWQTGATGRLFQHACACTIRGVRKRRERRQADAWLRDDRMLEAVKAAIRAALVDMFERQYEVPYIASFCKEVSCSCHCACPSTVHLQGVHTDFYTLHVEAACT